MPKNKRIDLEPETDNKKQKLDEVEHKLRDSINLIQQEKEKLNTDKQYESDKFKTRSIEKQWVAFEKQIEDKMSELFDLQNQQNKLMKDLSLEPYREHNKPNWFIDACDCSTACKDSKVYYVDKEPVKEIKDNIRERSFEKLDKANALNEQMQKKIKRYVNRNKIALLRSIYRTTKKDLKYLSMLEKLINDPTISGDDAYNLIKLMSEYSITMNDA